MNVSHFKDDNSNNWKQSIQIPSGVLYDFGLLDIIYLQWGSPFIYFMRNRMMDIFKLFCYMLTISLEQLFECEVLDIGYLVGKFSQSVNQICLLGGDIRV